MSLQASNKKIVLSVIIVNFRTPHVVIDCLETLLPELKDLNARVVLVDNKSEDDSVRLISSWLDINDADKRVLLIEADSNAGFSAGNNLGVRALEADYFLLLNSDTLVRQDSIKILLKTAQEHPEAGLVSPRLEWPDGKGQESCFRFHTPFSELLGAASTGVIDKLLKKYLVAYPVQKSFFYPQWTSFACVLIRNEVFNQIGLMDDGYFMYYEDVEFCHRAGKAGWQILHEPDSHVIHLRGGSSPVKKNTLNKKRLPRYYYQSRARYFYQLYGWWGLFAANALWWMGRMIAKTRGLVERKNKVEVEKKWLDIWINWLKPLSQYTHPDNR